MPFELQPTLQNDLIKLRPLQPSDFENLFEVASDPLIWAQHPNKDRYKKDVFQNYFEGAIQSGGAFLIIDQSEGKIIGCTRYYDHDEEKKIILIGYTFLCRSHWGGIYNPMVKKLMLQHAFQFVDSVHFHIGANNLRSQKAIEKIGATKIGEKQVEYYGESSNLNFIYEVKKD